MTGRHIHGGTTVSGTMLLSHLAGIRVFGTGGLGEHSATTMFYTNIAKGAFTVAGNSLWIYPVSQLAILSAS